jgi:beta-N-acetylhexosaminidase
VTERLAAIFGCAGDVLTEVEEAFFRDVKPIGLILFARNCQAPEQVRILIQSWRDVVGSDDVLVSIDQEGGRVCRLGPPHWRSPPAAAEFGRLFDVDEDLGVEAARLNGQVVAAQLRELGINVDCVPVLDVPVAGAHDIIGDRAYAFDPDIIAVLGRATCDGLQAGGVLPVIKHIPGHGRATVDSHEALPVVSASREDLDRLDFAPFRTLAALPLAMTAHVVFTALDERRPATTSPAVIELIRNDIGFDGLLMTDDLSMKALPGSMEDRTRDSRAAGCDVVLHCNGEAGEMTAIAGCVGSLDAEGQSRLDRALGRLHPPEPIDSPAAVARIDSLLRHVSAGART